MLQDYVSRELPAPAYRFYLAAINKEVPDMAESWQGITRNNAKSVDANTMWAFFEKMLADLTINNEELKPQMTTLGKLDEVVIPKDKAEREKGVQVLVPPYLQELTYIIHKPMPEARVKVYQNNLLLEDLPTTVIKDKDKYIETITILNPRPGFHLLKLPLEGDLRVFGVKTSADFRCDEIGATPQFIPVRLRCEVTGKAATGENKPLPPYEDAQYRLMVETAVVGPSQDERLTLAPQGANTYASYYVPSRSGDYTYIVSATTKDPNNNTYPPFQMPTGKDPDPSRNPVYGAGTFTVRPTTPRLSSAGTPTALLPMTLTVRLTDASGADLSVPDAAQPYIKMEALVSAAGKEHVVHLQAERTGYQGTFTPPQPADYQVKLQGHVQNPATGQALLPFNQEIGVLSVAAPKLVWRGFHHALGSIPAGRRSLYPDRPTGTAIRARLDPDFQLEARAEVRSDESTIPITLTVTDKGSWAGQLAPDTPGNFTLFASISAADARGGQVELIRDQPLFPFTVRPTTLVRAVVLKPTTESRFAWRDILWRPQPLNIEAALVDKDGRPLQAAEMQANPNTQPLSAALVPPSGGVGVSLPLVQSDAPGQYRATFTDYPQFKWYDPGDLGWHEIRIRPTGDLKDTFVYEKPEGVSVRVELRRSPLWWVLPAVITLALLLLAALVAYLVYLFTSPVRGQLVFAGARVTGGQSTVPVGQGRRIVRVQKRRLAQYGLADLAAVKVQRTGRTEDGKETIKFWAWDTNKEPIVPGDELTSGESTFVCDGVSAR